MTRAPARAAQTTTLALAAATALGGCGAAPIESVSPRASDSDLLSGLLAHWPFDEKDGSTVIDHGPKGYNGVLAGTPTWDTTGGRFGGGLRLRSGDSVTIPFPDPMPPDWTVSVWVKLTDAEQAAFMMTDRAVLLSSELPGMGGWEIEFDPRPGFQYLEASYYLSTANAYVILECRCIEFDRWMQFTAVYDSTTRFFSLYHDGRFLEKSMPLKGPSAGDSNLSIGRWIKDLRPLPGTIDDFAIWNRALNDDEIATLNARAVPELH